MGSFTEVVVAFEFRPDADPLAIAPFRRWQVGEGPELPDPLDLDDGLLEGVFDDGPLDPAAYARLPPAVQATIAAAQFAGTFTAYIVGDQSQSLAWHGNEWVVTARFCLKSYPEELMDLLAPLGQFTNQYADPDEDPEFLGYMRNDDEQRPILIWHRGNDRFEYEDLR